MAEWHLADAERIRASLTKQQENDISMLYRRVYLQTRQQMLAIPKDGTTSQKIQRQYLDKLHRQLDDAYKSLGVGLEKKIAKEAKKTAEGVVEEAKAFTKKAGFTIEGAFSKVPQDVVNSLVTGQVYGGSWSLSGAIWADVNRHQSDIGKVIAEGVAANKGAYEIAKDLEKYVDPKAKKPWDWGKVYPGTAKKVDYNAQRLARTMVSHAYQQSLERVCKNNPFVTGYIWRSAHSSRVCPICAERDGEFFEKGELPLDHPNGMCTFIANIPISMADVSNRLADWAKGGKDPELDKWAQAMTGTKPAPVFNDAQNKWLKPLGYSPENMPKNFAEFAMDLSFEQQSELLSLAGGDWGSPHPYQLMEAYYKQNLMTVRKGFIPVTKQTPLPIGMDKDAMESMFRSQSGKIRGELDTNASEWWGTLTGEQQNAVRKYTGSLYRRMNGFLRGTASIDNDDDPDYIRDLISNCQSALSKASSPRDLVVGRGSRADSLIGMLGDLPGMTQAANKDSLAKWLTDNRDSIIGSVAKDEAFLSTTPYEGGGFNSQITYRIHVPKGSPGAYVDSYSLNRGEEEFLLQSGGKFRISDIVPGYGNRATVYMEYLKPEK